MSTFRTLGHGSFHRAYAVEGRFLDSTPPPPAPEMFKTPLKPQRLFFSRCGFHCSDWSLGCPRGMPLTWALQPFPRHEKMRPSAPHAPKARRRLQPGVALLQQAPAGCELRQVGAGPMLLKIGPGSGGPAVRQTRPPSHQRNLTGGFPLKLYNWAGHPKNNMSGANRLWRH